MSEENVHTVSRNQWLQMAVGLCVTVVFGLVAYIVALLNQQVGNTIAILQTADKLLVERVNELEKYAAYNRARGESNEQRLERVEAVTRQQWQEINALKSKR